MTHAFRQRCIWNKDFIDTLNKVVTSVALICGGGFALYKFYGQRAVERKAQETYEAEHFSALQMTVVPEVIDYNDEAKLMLVHLNLKNLGSRSIVADDRGCVMRIWSLDDTKSLADGITWEDRKAFGNDIDILKGLGDPYVLKPNIEFHEVEPVLVESNRLYVIRVRFYAENSEHITEYKFVRAAVAKGGTDSTRGL